MADSTATAAVQISEPMTSNVGRLSYRVVLKDRGGTPLPGERLDASLEGDGSLAPGFDSKEIRLTTDESGAVRVTWYRRSIYTRGVKATLTVDPLQTDRSVALESVDPEVSVTSYDRPGAHKTYL